MTTHATLTVYNPLTRQGDTYDLPDDVEVSVTVFIDPDDEVDLDYEADSSSTGESMSVTASRVCDPDPDEYEPIVKVSINTLTPPEVSHGA